MTIAMTDYITFTGDGKPGRTDSGPALSKELPIALFLNGRHLITLSASPDDPAGLVTGYLFTEQIITKSGDIESIRIEQNRVSVLTTNLFSGTLPKKTILSGCGGSTSYINPQTLPRIEGDTVFSRDMIAVQVRELIAGAAKNAGTGLIHGRLIPDSGDVLEASDIGKHNLVDRLIGAALRDNQSMPGSVLVTTGAISGEIVRKCLVASIPVLVSVEGSTDLAVDLAQKNGLTIGVHASPEGMYLLSHHGRIR